jgi:uncharacterized protein YdeI (YjbR/CyaY-like superfamily)
LTGDDLPVHPFATAAELEAWLEENHGFFPGVWLKIAKKGADEPRSTSSVSSTRTPLPETRTRRLRKFVVMLERGEKIHG